MKSTAVVLLNWNGQKLLEQFLPLVISYTPEADIIVADNASTDQSIDLLKKKFPTVQIICNPTNEGFANGYNRALKGLSYPYLLLLNTDIEVTPGWLSPLIKMMDDDKTIAACQPKIKSFAEQNKFEHAGAAGGFIDKYGYPFCRGRIFNFLEDDHGQYDTTTEVFWASGACLMIRSELYRSVGGLDGEFFAHMEEIDLCWRLKKAGYRIVCNPLSMVYHIGGGTLPKINPQKTYLNFRNNLLMLYKNLPVERKSSVFFVRLILDFLASVKFLLEGDIKDSVVVVKAYAYFFRTLPGRRKLYKKDNLRQNPEVSGVYKKSIVIEHFIKRKKTFSQLKSDLFS